MSKITDLAAQMIRNNPNIQQTPFAQAGMNAILNNDAKAGEQLANNILKSVGMTKEQALQIAKQQNLFGGFHG